MKRSVDEILRWLARKGIKVIDHVGAAKFWDIPIPQDVQIRYSEETLSKAIAANCAGEQWTLAYYCGLSLWEMKEMRSPFFNDNNEKGFIQKKDPWSTDAFEPGYYLLNFTGKFANQSWLKQGKLIFESGSEYKRAYETIVAETVLSNFSLHGGERIMEDWYHWGKGSVMGIYYICIGEFVNGLRANAYVLDKPRDSLRVILFWEFDF